VKIGGVLSTTLTVDGHCAYAFWLSVTVRVTGNDPRPNGPVLSSDSVTLPPSGSDDPLSTAEAATVAWQVPSAFTVTTGRQSATGGRSSCRRLETDQTPRPASPT
jgi:hypothetical protein